MYGERKRGRIGRALGAIVVALLLVPWAGKLEAATPSPTRYATTAGSVPVQFPYFSSRLLGVADPSIRRILVLIHGTSFNAEDYLMAGLNALDRVPGSAAETLIIAPQVLRDSEITGTITGPLLFWQNSPFWGTARAYVGQARTVVSLSVFTVLDRMLADLVLGDNYPNLETVVVFGHSGGGQLVQRYAAVGRFDHAAARARGVHLRYVVSAPSSYVYMDAQRPVLGSPGQFRTLTPGEVEACPDYDDFGSGLQAPYLYVAETGADKIRTQYGERIVLYVVGGNDNNPEHSSLSRTCAANLQGLQRVERMTRYYDYLQHYYGPDIRRRHDFSIEPGIGHNGTGLAVSPTGLRWLLDYDPRDTDKDGYSDWDEWKAGSDPRDANSRPAATAEATAGGALRLVWPGLQGRSYGVERWQGDKWLEVDRRSGVTAPMIWEPGSADPADAALYRLSVRLD